MPTTVSCVLPKPVTQLLSERYRVSPYSCLLRAVKDYTNTSTSIDASAAVGRLALERGCTKTDVCRDALIKFDPDIADVWPAPQRSKAAIARSHAVMADPAKTSTQQLAKVRAALVKLRDRVPTMTSRQIANTLSQIIDKIPG